MAELRKPLFFVALGAMLLVVLAELGTGIALPTESGVQLGGLLDELPEDSDVNLGDLETLRQDQPTPPGLGIPRMVLLDALLLFTVGLMGAALLIPERIHGRVQGIVSLVVSLLVLIASIGAIFEALGKLMLMVALFMAPPFGTLAYMAIYGFFPKDAAAGLLGLLMLLKLIFLGALFFAHPRFLENKGLMLIIATSLLANFVVALLHSLVPGFLVSITDAVAAIVVAVLAAIWAIVFLVSAIVSIVKALRFDKSR